MARVTIFALFVLALCGVCISAANGEKCGPHAVFNPCAKGCPVTCLNVHNPPKNCPTGCVARCECKEGYIFNKIGKCIFPKACFITNL